MIPVQVVYLVKSNDISLIWEVDLMLLCIFWFMDYSVIFLPKIFIFLCEMPFVLSPSINLVMN